MALYAIFISIRAIKMLLCATKIFLPQIILPIQANPSAILQIYLPIQQKILPVVAINRSVLKKKESLLQKYGSLYRFILAFRRFKKRLVCAGAVKMSIVLEVL